MCAYVLIFRAYIFLIDMPIYSTINGFGFGRWQSGNVTYNTTGTAQWAAFVDSPGTGQDRIQAIVCDSSLNVYIAGFGNPNSQLMLAYDASGNGQVSSLYSIQGIPLLNVSLAFLVKYDTNGKCQWVSALETGDTAESNFDMTIDTTQNVYATGTFMNGTGIFRDASGYTTVQSAVTISPPVLGRCAYLYKMNPNGITQWANCFVISTDINQLVEGLYCQTDTNDNIYYGGYYRIAGTGNIQLIDASGTTQRYSPSNVIRQSGNVIWDFLIKSDSNGKTLWSTYIAANHGADQTINRITTDIFNNVYYATTINQTSITFVDASGFSQSNSLYTLNRVVSTTNSYAGLVKYNSNGKVQWSVGLDGLGVDESRTVVTDTQGSIYWIGTMRSQPSTPTSTVVVRDASGTTQSNSPYTLGSTVSVTDPSVFIIKYNQSGKVQWATRCDQANSDEYAFNAVTDSLNNLYVVGRGNSGANIPLVLFDASGFTQSNSGILIPGIAGGGIMGWIAKYNSNGKAQWVTYLDGAGTDWFYGVAVDRTNSVYVGGGNQTNNVIVRDVSGNRQKASAIRISTLNANNTAGSFIKYR